MCQRLLVGYRLELVAICVHAIHENTLGWLIFGEMVESLPTCCWGFSRIHAEHTSSFFSFLETMWCCGLIIIMLVWLVARLHMHFVVYS